MARSALRAASLVVKSLTFLLSKAHLILRARLGEGVGGSRVLRNSMSEWKLVSEFVIVAGRTSNSAVAVLDWLNEHIKLRSVRTLDSTSRRAVVGQRNPNRRNNSVFTLSESVNILPGISGRAEKVVCFACCSQGYISQLNGTGCGTENRDWVSHSQTGAVS